VSPIGELAEAMAPHTEADPAALLIHGLVLFGNLVGRNPTFRVGGDVHRVNEDAVCSGDTSIGRKGLAWAEISAVMREVDPIWADTGLQTGLSSGEGLIHVVRDTVEVEELVQVRGGAITGTQRVVKDPGVLDKRVTIIEPEFAKTLRVSRREGNTLSAVIRQAWDDGNLRVLTRQNPIRATGAHLSIIGHITPEELRRELRTTDMASGFINRFLVVLARRSRSLPEGGAMERSVRARLVARLQQAAERARQVHELSRDDESREHWHAVYPQLTRPRVGLVGAICNRAPAHVLRLSCIYALADESALIRLKHQLAALAVWRYAEASAIRIFGLKTGNRLADFFLALLRQHPEGLTRTQLSEALHKHGRADEIHAALQLLSEYGLARCEQQPASKSGGRPVHRWFAVNFDAK
jgi:hypothetical protein